MKSDLVDIAVVMKGETALAYKVDAGTGEDIWFPKSQCEFDDGILTMPEWLAKEKGVI